MNSPAALLRSSPVVARVAPFVVFIVLTAGQAWFGEAGRYWCYLGKTVVVAWMLLAVRPVVSEMRWAWSWPAAVTGIAVFLLWVGLDDLLMRLGFPKSYPKVNLSGASWNPPAFFGEGSALGWFFLFIRVVGSSLIVPPMEEVFFRSFLYRYVAKVDFLSVPLGRFLPVPFFITALIFGAEHREWLAGVLCAFAYQGLVCWKKRLGDAIAAHAITNFLLGLWVVGKGAWHFW